MPYFLFAFYCFTGVTLQNTCISGSYFYENYCSVLICIKVLALIIFADYWLWLTGYFWLTQLDSSLMIYYACIQIFYLHNFSYLTSFQGQC